MNQQQTPLPRQPRRTWARSVALGTVATMALAGGGAVLASSGTSASAAPNGTTSAYRLVDDPPPPPGKAWIQGVVTDQANHALDNVNVEVWPADPTATEPVATNLTYAGTPADQRHQHGVFRLEVPMNEPYVVVLSAIGRSEDGDPYRMKTLGQGRPIMARPHATGAQRLSPGRVLDLGRFQLARQGKVSATTTAKLAKAKVGTGDRARLRVKVTSRFVSAPTGRLVVRVGGKKVTDRLRSTDAGRTSVRLPKFAKPGKHRVRVTFPATSTIKRSVSKPDVLKVR